MWVDREKREHRDGVGILYSRHNHDSIKYGFVLFFPFGLQGRHKG